MSTAGAVLPSLLSQTGSEHWALSCCILYHVVDYLRLKVLWLRALEALSLRLHMSHRHSCLGCSLELLLQIELPSMFLWAVDTDAATGSSAQS